MYSNEALFKLVSSQHSSFSDISIVKIMMLHDVQYHSLSQDEDVRSVAYCLGVVVVALIFTIVVVVVASTFAIHAPSA